MKLFFELNQNGGNEENNDNENNEENNYEENNNEENKNGEQQNNNIEQENNEEENNVEENNTNIENINKEKQKENNNEEENNSDVENNNEEENNVNDEENNLNEIISFLKDEKLSNTIINHLAENIELEIVKITGNNDLIVLTDKNNLKYKKLIKDFKNIKIAIVSIVKVKDKTECIKYKKFYQI